MRKLTLMEWAEVGEVIAAVAVVASLLLVFYSIERNTNALQGGTENLLFESHTTITKQMVSDPSLVAIRLKVRKGEPLSEAESIRWTTFQNLLLDVWAMAYMRHQEDLLADRQWKAWDTYFISFFKHGDARLSEERWHRLVSGFDAGFWTHVHQSLYEND